MFEGKEDPNDVKEDEPKVKKNWVDRDFYIICIVDVRSEGSSHQNTVCCASVCIESGDGKLIMMDDDDAIISEYPSNQWRSFTVERYVTDTE